MLRSRISSDIKELTHLNKSFPWIPNEHTIRPNDYYILKKVDVMNHIETQWSSLRDFILHMVFRQSVSFNEDEKLCVVSPSPPVWIFDHCMFPYNLPFNANHFVLWNSYHTFSEDIDEKAINDIIAFFIEKRLGHTDFDFAWYKNPKPSVTDFYHVQVFWIKIDNITYNGNMV